MIVALLDGNRRFGRFVHVLLGTPTGMCVLSGYYFF